MKKSIQDAYRSASNPTLNTKGAFSYKSTLSDALDVFTFLNHFAYSDLKNQTSDVTNLERTLNHVIDDDIDVAFSLFLQNLDIANGKGERTSSIVFAYALARADSKKFSQIIDLIIQKNGWRLVMILYGAIYNDKPVLPESVRMVVLNKMLTIFNALLEHKDVSYEDKLLVKWLINPDTSNEFKHDGLNILLHDLDKLSKTVAPKFWFNQAVYRKLRSQLRKIANLNLIETNLVNKTYDNIEIAKLPKRTQRLHTKWFEEHMPKEYETFIKSFNIAKTDAKSLRVYELFHDFMTNTNKAYSALNFFATIKDLTIKSNFLPVIDSSGSMDGNINDSSISLLEVASSLGLAMAFKNKGDFHNAVIRFGDFSEFSYFKADENVKSLNDTTAVDLLHKAVKSIWNNKIESMGTTNLASVFDLILKVGKQNKENVPDGIVIFSDGEFDPVGHNMQTVFEEYIDIFKKAEIKFPLVVSWNLSAKPNFMFDRNSPILSLSGFNVSLLNLLLNTDVKDLTAEGFLFKALNPYLEAIKQAFATKVELDDSNIKKLMKYIKK